MARSTGIYAEPAKTTKLGYAKEGAKLAVQSLPVSKAGCSAGWYQLVSGGYICGNEGTLNANDERVKHPPKQANVEGVLPYVYARNVSNGTPLYRSVPTREQIKKYEPYLYKDKEAEEKKAEAPPVAAPAPTLDEATRRAREDQARRMAALRDAQRAMLGEEAARKLEEEESQERGKKRDQPAVAAANDDPDAGAPQQWWEQDKPDLSKLKLGDLAQDADDVISGRMAKGFYVAIERTFNWSGRTWYRTTQGQIAPADRFVQVAGPEFHGVELGTDLKLPVAWAYGASKTKPLYTVDAEHGTAKSSGTIAHHAVVALTGKELQIGKATYLETVDGTWVKQADVRATKPGAPPADIGPDELWIDVNLSTQSLVLFRGTEAIYATLISSGKESDDKEKDHRSPLGEYRIREKHVTTIMDGDGTAAGDLPYSIEAVPYVMYFHKAYALHGAFWHSNFGVRMSHGCVNLAPLDAKYLFFHSDPPVADGLSGSLSSSDRPGSRVVIHE
jgi:lipoprotein-anchoring transpeptidase ErfK/SrfK